jgi:antitoxin component YwqK of YwqJK toxin-antitoxin module
MDATPGVLSSRSESAQEEQPKRKFYEDGQLKQEAVYAEGMKNGLFQSWFPNGQRKIRGTMENDRWNGSYEEWYEDGTPRIVGQYLLGKQHGEWRFFDKTGTPMPSLRYEEGLEVTRELPDLLP